MCVYLKYNTSNALCIERERDNRTKFDFEWNGLGIENTRKKRNNFQFNVYIYIYIAIDVSWKICALVTRNRERRMKEINKQRIFYSSFPRRRKCVCCCLCMVPRRCICSCAYFYDMQCTMDFRCMTIRNECVRVREREREKERLKSRKRLNSLNESVFHISCVCCICVYCHENSNMIDRKCLVAIQLFGFFVASTRFEIKFEIDNLTNILKVPLISFGLYFIHW